MSVLKSTITDWVILMLASIVGCLAWLPVCALPLYLLADQSGETTVYGILMCGSIGAVLGIGQLFVLRWYVPRVWWWPPVKAVGYPLGFWAVFALQSVFPLSAPYTWVLWWVVVGVVMGITQSIVNVPLIGRKLQWLLISPLVWAVGSVIGLWISAVIGGSQNGLSNQLTAPGLVACILFAESVLSFILIWLMRAERKGTLAEEFGRSHSADVKQ